MSTDWTTPRILKAAVDFRCAAITEHIGYRSRCNAFATDVIDNSDGTSYPVCPEHGGKP